MDSQELEQVLLLAKMELEPKSIRTNRYSIASNILPFELVARRQPAGQLRVALASEQTEVEEKPLLRSHHRNTHREYVRSGKINKKSIIDAPYHSKVCFADFVDIEGIRNRHPFHFRDGWCFGKVNLLKHVRRIIMNVGHSALNPGIVCVSGILNIPLQMSREEKQDVNCTL
jgi:hypothetical protein